MGILNQINELQHIGCRKAEVARFPAFYDPCKKSLGNLIILVISYAFRFEWLLNCLFFLPMKEKDFLLDLIVHPQYQVNE